MVLELIMFFCIGFEKCTKRIDDNLNPEWNEVIIIIILHAMQTYTHLILLLMVINHYYYNDCV